MDCGEVYSRNVISLLTDRRKVLEHVDDYVNSMGKIIWLSSEKMTEHNMMLLERKGQRLEKDKFNLSYFPQGKDSISWLYKIYYDLYFKREKK